MQFNHSQLKLNYYYFFPRSRGIHVIPSGVPEFLYIFQQDKTVRGIPAAKRRAAGRSSKFLHKERSQATLFLNHKFREMIPTARLWQPQLIHPI